jgi:UTP:GlnB (protein PII) uridylyltransferase
VFLEGVVSGAQDVEPLLEGRLPELKLAAGTPLSVEWDDASHPRATRLLLKAPDRFGLLYLVSRTLSLCGCNIEMADVATPSGRALDSFYLTRGGGRLGAGERRAVEGALGDLVALGSLDRTA